MDEFMHNVAGRASGGALGMDGLAKATLTTAGPLDKLYQSLSELQKKMYEVTRRLGQHADTVYGPVPSETETREDHQRSIEDTKLGRLFGMSEELHRDFNRLAQQADRNCTLA